MECKCGSDRVLALYGKVSDRCCAVFKGAEHDGYPPSVGGICGGDDINVSVCLECGQVCGTDFPKPDPIM